MANGFWSALTEGMHATETLSAALTAIDKGDLTNLLDISVSLIIFRLFLN